jgi:hypothetical protein
LFDWIVIVTGTLAVVPGPFTIKAQLTWVAPAGTTKVAVPVVPEAVPVQKPAQPNKVDPSEAVPVRV